MSSNSKVFTLLYDRFDGAAREASQSIRVLTLPYLLKILLKGEGTTARVDPINKRRVAWLGNSPAELRQYLEPDRP